jgi:hypothetical protein
MAVFFFDTSALSNGSISHDWNEETIEAKARWFQSLSLEERMDLFCSFTDLALAANPALIEGAHVEPVAGRVQVLSLSSNEDLIASKRASGRDADLEDVRLLEAADTQKRE